MSAQVTFDVFVRPALLRMQGARVVGRPVVEVELLRAGANRSGRRHYLPARIRFEDGRLVARPGALAGLGRRRGPRARQRPASSSTPRARSAEAGERAAALLLGNFLERDGVA